ncbi:hypothetical protein [Natrinema amylolyticum]|uniref:hypothetical protein n=1 Tax=Natrinema amylolyticum TaxID=2878679 RepID=UPI001CF9A676|nr:hypothetical protein [Natrinema amylolyticum]
MVPAPHTGPPSDDGPSTPADDPDDGRSGSFRQHAARVAGRFDEFWAFALVPLFTALLEFEKVQRALAHTGRGFAVNFEFLLPTPLVDLWRFADPPDPPATTRTTSGDPHAPSIGDAPGDPAPTGEPTTPVGSTGSGGPDVTIETPVETVAVPLEAISAETMAWLGLALAAYAVISGILMAAYVGGLDRRLRGEPLAVGSCVVAYAPRFVLYNLVAFGTFLLVLPVFVLVRPLVWLAFPAIIVLGYVFYPVPFLFVVDDAPFLEAFRQSIRLTTAGGPVLSFAFWHAIAAVVVSAVLSVSVSSGSAGLLLALLVSAPVGVLLTAATVSFFRAHLEGADPGATGGSSSDAPGRGETDEYGFATD